MATSGDIENHNGDLLEPLKKKTQQKYATDHNFNGSNGGLVMVLLSTGIAVSGSFVFGCCVGYSAPTQFGIMNELSLSYSEAMRMSSIICIAGWIAIYLSKVSLLLDFGRFLTGYGIGILSYVVPVFISKITPKDLRGSLASANQFFNVVGILAIYLIGALVRWRMLALAGNIPCLVMLVGLCFIPESPRWLAKYCFLNLDHRLGPAMVGRHHEFEASLQKLRGAKADISREESDIQDSIAQIEQLPKVTIQDLFHRRNIRFVIVGVGLMVSQQFGGINVLIKFLYQQMNSLFLNITYMLRMVLLTAFVTCLIDRAGRRPLLMISAFGLLMGNLIIATSFFLKGHHLAIILVPILAITGVMFYIASFSIGMGAIPWVLMSELFPLHIKGTAGSLVTLVNCFGSWFISFTFNFLMEWSSYGTFLVYACICACSIIFIDKLVPETKGRTLEEIQACVN